jgi:hypothetical protein
MVKAVAATPPTTMNWRRDKPPEGDELQVAFGFLGGEFLPFIREFKS